VIFPGAVGAMITLATGLLVLSFRRLDGLDDEAEGWLNARFRHESSGRASALARLVRGIWRDVVETYLSTNPYEPAPLSASDLRAAAAAMDADSTAVDVRSRQLVVEPVLNSVAPEILARASRIAAAVVNLPDTDDALSALACHDLDMGLYRSKVRLLLIWYGFQLVATGLLLLAAISLFWASLLALVAGILAAAVGIAIHCLALELWRLRLKWTLRVRSTAADLAREAVDSV
jgi:hypothetical protein